MRRTLVLLSIAAGLLAALPATRADDGAAKAATGERRRVLDDGLEVVVVPSARAKAVVVVTTYRAGPRDEAREESGISQLVARLYQRSAAGSRAAGAADQQLAALASAVTQNASGLTGFDVRHDALAFWATAPEDKLGDVLEVERDRMAALAPTADGLEGARSEAVFESARSEGKPTTRAWNTLYALAYGDCGLGRPRQGLPKNVSALQLKDVEAWRHAHLRPDTAAILVYGAHDADAALEKVARTFATVPRPAEPLPPRAPVAACPPGPLRASIEGPSVTREILVGYRGPDAGSEDEAAFLALCFELKDKVVSALKGAVHDVSVSVDARAESPALLVVSASPRGTESTADLESRVGAAVSTFREGTFGDAGRLRDRVRHVLDNLTRPADALLAKKDDAATLVDAACDRATSEPLVQRREALEKRLASLAPDGLRDAAHFYFAADRARVVVIAGN